MGGRAARRAGDRTAAYVGRVHVDRGAVGPHGPCPPSHPRLPRRDRMGQGACPQGPWLLPLRRALGAHQRQLERRLFVDAHTPSAIAFAPEAPADLGTSSPQDYLRRVVQPLLIAALVTNRFHYPMAAVRRGLAPAGTGQSAAHPAARGHVQLALRRTARAPSARLRWARPPRGARGRRPARARAWLPLALGETAGRAGRAPLRCMPFIGLLGEGPLRNTACMSGMSGHLLHAPIWDAHVAAAGLGGGGERLLRQAARFASPSSPTPFSEFGARCAPRTRPAALIAARCASGVCPRGCAGGTPSTAGRIGAARAARGSGRRESAASSSRRTAPRARQRVAALLRE